MSKTKVIPAAVKIERYMRKIRIKSDTLRGLLLELFRGSLDELRVKCNIPEEDGRFSSHQILLRPEMFGGDSKPIEAFLRAVAGVVPEPVRKARALHPEFFFPADKLRVVAPVERLLSHARAAGIKDMDDGVKRRIEDRMWRLGFGGNTSTNGATFELHVPKELTKLLPPARKAGYDVAAPTVDLDKISHSAPRARKACAMLNEHISMRLHYAMTSIKYQCTMDSIVGVQTYRKDPRSGGVRTLAELAKAWPALAQQYCYKVGQPWPTEENIESLLSGDLVGRINLPSTRAMPSPEMCAQLAAELGQPYMAVKAEG